jgi:hypothetical protein
MNRIQTLDEIISSPLSTEAQVTAAQTELAKLSAGEQPTTTEPEDVGTVTLASKIVVNRPVAKRLRAEATRLLEHYPGGAPQSLIDQKAAWLAWIEISLDSLDQEHANEQEQKLFMRDGIAVSPRTT